MKRRVNVILNHCSLHLTFSLCKLELCHLFTFNDIRVWKGPMKGASFDVSHINIQGGIFFGQTLFWFFMVVRKLFWCIYSILPFSFFISDHNPVPQKSHLSQSSLISFCKPWRTWSLVSQGWCGSGPSAAHSDGRSASQSGRLRWNPQLSGWSSIH